MKIAIAHDYLLQHGGAERVVASWASHLDRSEIYSLAYGEGQTFDIFRDRNVNSRIQNKYAKRNMQFLLPILPLLAKQVKVEGDVALISTSGWAHRFNFDMPTVAYVHSPARWLYARQDYSQQLGVVGRLGLAASAPFLLSSDGPAMRRMDAVISNSRVSQKRIWDAYRIESQIVHPPVERLRGLAVAPMRRLPEKYALVVSRNRGYKNVKLAVASAKAAGLISVVVGSGTESYDGHDAGVIGLGRVTDAELKWLYQNTSVLVGSAHEDFGLTVLEANLEGAPVAAIPAGGYLETVSPGRNGFLATAETSEALSVAIRAAVGLPAEGCQSWASAFSLPKHMETLLGVLHETLGVLQSA